MRLIFGKYQTHKFIYSSFSTTFKKETAYYIKTISEFKNNKSQYISYLFYCYRR